MFTRHPAVLCGMVEGGQKGGGKVVLELEGKDLSWRERERGGGAQTDCGSVPSGTSDPSLTGGGVKNPILYTGRNYDDHVGWHPD